ncbi:MAG: DUF898 domain-containing protein [Nitrospina sp.]|jgi:uncharacterized membrane protein YjgN (DUF898 family)|nr:DUF898 domain-containing protein [Nitrospina sp.]
MSYQITLNSWSGANKTEAAKKLSKVFWFDNEKSMTIVDRLCQGQPWRFDRPIPDHQADLASTFLRSLGFSVDLQPVEGETTPLSDSVAQEESQEDVDVAEDRSSYRFNFQGDGRTLFNISFVNLIKMVFTLGIYRFWAKTIVRRYFWSQTLFSGDRFSYHGTAKELIRGAIFLGLVLILLGLFNAYVFFNVGLIEGELVSNLISFIIVALLPALLTRAWRYRLSRTAWRNIRFSFRGKGMSAFVLYFIEVTLTIVTFGLYWPFFKIKTEKFWRENSWFGDVQFRFSGVGKDFFKKFLFAVVLTPLTLGFFMFWFTADLKRYLWSHTHVGGATFNFPITGRDYMRLKVANFFIILFTLGLGYPWVMVRNQKFLTGNLTLAGNIELNRIVQEMKDSGAFGEEALDAIDVPIEIG